MHAAEILARVRALTPAISSRSGEIEHLRRLPDDLVAELKRAGAFRMARSRAKGGPQLSLPEQLRIIEELAYADSSVGWCVKIGADSGLIAEFLPEEASRRLLPDPDSITAGQFTAGRGRLDRVAGGYVLNGRFPFGSISNHADAIMSGAVIHEDGAPAIGADGLPETRLALARADQYVIEDTWRTHGLRGTGSNHYRAENVFIPESQALKIDAALFEGREPLYSSGFNWVTTMAAVPLGIARRAMDEAKKLVADRQGGIPPRPMAELAFVRDAIAKAEMRRGAAHAFLFASAEQFWTELERGAPSIETRGHLALSNVNACRMASEVTRMLFDLIGANAIFDGSVLERLTRDALTVNQHMIVSAAHLEFYGAMILGQPHPSPLY
ncbi:MAG: acyl-CoA dehydrogenase family protein [Novosphingobium sp.]|nr:acyl-CoA dehydrogenase family protein [Novosphingobium sp.]